METNQLGIFVLKWKPRGNVIEIDGITNGQNRIRDEHKFIQFLNTILKVFNQSKRIINTIITDNT